VEDSVLLPPLPPPGAVLCVRILWGAQESALCTPSTTVSLNGGNVSVPDLTIVRYLFISASITRLHNPTTDYIINDNNNTPRKVTVIGTFPPRLPPLDRLDAAACVGRQSPEPSRISSGTRTTGLPPFVYTTSKDPLLPTANCVQDKILEIASEFFL
jgi:hypothetical protein